jgi:hypothetical protein
MRNRMRKLLDLQGVLPNAKPAPRSLPVLTEKASNEYVNWDNANRAGLFTDEHVDELDKMIAQQKRLLAKPITRVEQKEERITIRNATKEQLQNALHKALVGKKS